MVLRYGRLYAAEQRVGNHSQDPYTLYTDCEKRVFAVGSDKPGLSGPYYGFYSETFTLLLLILGGIETDPCPTSCAICHPINWNQYGVWCGRGGWLNLICTNLQSIDQWDQNLDCERCSGCKIMEANLLQSLPIHDNSHFNILQLNCNALKQKQDIIDWMLKINIQIAAKQETNLD